MIEQLSIFVVGVTGGYLAALGLAALVVPARTARFLLGFASTHRLHLLEMLCRVIVGASLIVAAPSLTPAQPFVLLGWLLLCTSALLLVLPWQWHQRFASMSVPAANRYLRLIGILSLLGGALILTAVLGGFAT